MSSCAEPGISGCPQPRRVGTLHLKAEFRLPGYRHLLNGITIHELRITSQIKSVLICGKVLPLSYRSLKTQVRESKIHGRGLFATTDIAKNEIVAVKGGHIISREELREKITPRLGPVEIQIDDDLFIAPVTEDERESSMLYSNHSCNPNLGMRGEITLVAMRDIRAGEELTHDWAMTDDDEYSVECKCGAPNCRGTLTGKDWQRPELQKRYAGYFSAYLSEKVARMNRRGSIR